MRLSWHTNRHTGMGVGPALFAAIAITAVVSADGMTRITASSPRCVPDESLASPEASPGPAELPKLQPVIRAITGLTT